MKMFSGNNLKAICSVTELARKLGLYRARFYQLLEKGVFPGPIYCIRTKRPFYPPDLQKECMEVRKTGIGRDGRPVLFYSPRQNKFGKSSKQSDWKYEGLRDTLQQMGLNVTLNRARDAVTTLYPDGFTKQPIQGIVIRNLFRYFELQGCQNRV